MQKKARFKVIVHVMFVQVITLKLYGRFSGLPDSKLYVHWHISSGVQRRLIDRLKKEIKD